MRPFPLKLDKSPATQGDWRTYSGSTPKTPLIGLPVPKGVLVLDLDTYKGVNRQKVEKLLGSIPWDEALIQKTGKGGEHYAFQVPFDIQIKQGSNILGIQGFDTRVSGKGYIATGEGYECLCLLGVAETLNDRDGLPRLSNEVLKKLTIKNQKPENVDLLSAVKEEPLDLTIEEVKKAIEALPDSHADDRDLWLKTGLAIYRQTKGSSEGWLIFDEFSKGCPEKYDRKKNYQTWKSFNRPYSGDPVTFASVLHVTKKDEFEKLIDEAKTIKTKQDLKTFSEKVKTKELSKAEKKQLSDEIKQNAKGTELEGITKPEIKKELSQDKTFNPNMPDWCKPWIFVKKHCEYLNTKTLEMIRERSFNSDFNKEKECTTYEMQASNLALNIFQIPRVYDTAYNPKEKEIFEDENGARFYNIFKSSGVKPCSIIDEDGQKVIDLFLAHLDFLIEKEEDKKIILNFLAHTIQKLGDRINWALVLQGCEGCGKSYFIDMLDHILGQNVKRLESNAIAERFTDWANEALVIAVEEIMITGENKYKTINKLKQFLTNKKIDIEEKGKPRKTVENVTNYIMLTNYQDAIPITDQSRRFCVIFTKHQRVEKMFNSLGGREGYKKYFDTLYNETERRADALHRFFLDFEIDERFPAKSYAPETDSKKIMESLSISPERNQIEDLIFEHECKVINDKMIDVTWLNNLALSEGSELPKSRVYGKILLELGYAQIDNRRVKINKTRTYHYVWIKPDEISSDEAKEIVVNFHDGDEEIPF